MGELHKVLKGHYYSLEVVLVCTPWYAQYPLNLRDFEDMMQERRVIVDHSTIHSRALKISSAGACFSATQGTLGDELVA